MGVIAPTAPNPSAPMGSMGVIAPTVPTGFMGVTALTPPKKSLQFLLFQIPLTFALLLGINAYISSSLPMLILYRLVFVA